MSRFTLKENVVIKKNVPLCGVCCSNPERMKRILELNLNNISEHTNSWGINIYTGTYKNSEIFVSSVPMGAAGSGFAFHELFAAGAKNIIRYGSNDYNVENDQLYDIGVVEKADNLFGLMRDSGINSEEWGKEIPCSNELLSMLVTNAKSSELRKINIVTCHNIEDYHAYNNPNLINAEERERVSKILEQIARLGKGAWDMESASLYFKAKQFNANTVTVLQSVIKRNINNNPYYESFANELLAVENIISKVVFDTLVAI